MKLNNPAARLLSILEKGLTKSPTGKCRSTWAGLLGVDPRNKALLMGRLGKVMALSTDIIECLNKIDGLKVERYLDWVGPLDTAFSKNNLNGNWQEFIAHINSYVINCLTMTSDLLSHKMPEPILSDSNLDNILNDARKLIDEVKGSDLPEKVKEYMVKQLHKICLSVEEYQITGAESISEVIESTFGHGVLYNESVVVSEKNSAAKKFWQYMANTALIVSISIGVQQLSPTVSKMLPDISFEKESNPINKSEQEAELVEE